jgi:hypothetical protein
MNAQRRSHGRACPPRRVSPYLRGQQRQTASTPAFTTLRRGEQRGGYNVREMHCGFSIRFTGYLIHSARVINTFAGNVG